jgi:hypothetical protein
LPPASPASRNSLRPGTPPTAYATRSATARIRQSVQLQQRLRGHLASQRDEILAPRHRAGDAHEQQGNLFN